MDSLLANYASSDEEESEDNIPNPKPSLFSFPKSPQTLTLIPPPIPQFHTQEQIPHKPTSLFSSLPKPISSISQFSLPIPKSQTLISPPNPQFQTLESKLDKPTSLFASLPKPISSISQLSLPIPKSVQSQTLISPPNPKIQIEEQNVEKTATLFASLPKPKSAISQFSVVPPPNPKKIVQVKIPVVKRTDFDDDDEEDDVREREGRKTESFAQTTSALSFLSSLPGAKNSSSTLGALPPALGSGRRSIVETSLPSSVSAGFSTEAQVGVGSNEVNYDGSSGNSEYGVSGGGESYVSYGGNSGYGNYDYYQQYNSNWSDGSAEVAQSSLGGVGESVMKVPGKRGRNEIPTNIVEVKQDELIKNRPREDQVKSTGIAFGPAYQPVSTKGKPSKLQKRKHQIGSLYFDMRQKESELAERRSKGFLTKAETQAKYGW